MQKFVLARGDKVLVAGPANDHVFAFLLTLLASPDLDDSGLGAAANDFRMQESLSLSH
jgi:hypothetical protein